MLCISLSKTLHNEWQNIEKYLKTYLEVLATVSLKINPGRNSTKSLFSISFTFNTTFSFCFVFSYWQIPSFLGNISQLFSYFVLIMFLKLASGAIFRASVRHVLSSMAYPAFLECLWSKILYITRVCTGYCCDFIDIY